jgi:ribosomal protein S18 acetylase RimI-like enzyme
MADVRALQAFLRTSAGRGRRVLRAGPFTVTIHPDDPLRFLNYAIPDDNAHPEDDAIGTLRDAFRLHERRPRLEWIEEAAPAVAPVLAAHGMVEELRTPLMTCAPGELVEASADVEALTVGLVGDADLRAGSNLQRAAFATWTAVVDGASEVAGVATAEAWRRRGLAGVVTAAAARAAFAAGARVCVLSPGHDEAQRVYARAGFRGTATMLHWSDPD